jgi:ribonuclease VapC
VIVDTSALIALLKAETGAETILSLLEEARGTARLSAANYLEAGIVVDRHLSQADAVRLDELIADFDIRVVDLTADQARLARQAYRLFGKHSGHPAKLDFGDCFAYALARETGEPLLFKGADFVHTDLVAASPAL